MAMLTAGCKRSAMLEEELLLLDPHQAKRYRFEEDDGATLPAEVEEALASAVAVATSSSSSGADAASTIASAASVLAGGTGRRRHHDDMDDQCDVDLGAPSDKRLRQMEGRSENFEVQAWAETLVRALQGCPSVDEAMRRCSRVLAEFSVEVRQSALRDFQQEESPPARPQDEQQNIETLQQFTKTLKRAIVHLVQRCRKLEADAQETASLRKALEQSQELTKRLNHSNEVLRGHLRVQMDACRQNLQAFSCP